MSGFHLEKTTVLESIRNPTRAVTDIIFGSFSAAVIFSYVLYSNKNVFNEMTTTEIVISLVLLISMFLIVRLLSDIVFLFIQNFYPSLKLGNSLAEWILGFVFLCIGTVYERKFIEILPVTNYYHMVPIFGTYVLYFLYSSGVIKI